MSTCLDKPTVVVDVINLDPLLNLSKTIYNPYVFVRFTIALSFTSVATAKEDLVRGISIEKYFGVLVSLSYKNIGYITPEHGKYVTFVEFCTGIKRVSSSLKTIG
jgi:hypothetical protein